MREFMEDYYKKMKEEQGIEINYALCEEDPEFDSMLRILRPAAKQKTFSQFLADQTKAVMRTSKSWKRQ